MNKELARRNVELSRCREQAQALGGCLSAALGDLSALIDAFEKDQVCYYLVY